MKRGTDKDKYYNIVMGRRFLKLGPSNEDGGIV